MCNPFHCDAIILMKCEYFSRTFTLIHTQTDTHTFIELDEHQPHRSSRWKSFDKQFGKNGIVSEVFASCCGHNNNGAEHDIQIHNILLHFKCLRYVGRVVLRKCGICLLICSYFVHISFRCGLVHIHKLQFIR